MSKQTYLIRIRDLFANLASQLQHDNKAGRVDLNTISEEIIRPVLQVVYSLPNLENLNFEHPNAPGVDLGDKVRRIAFQVTSRVTNQKVLHTIGKIVENDLYKDYDEFFVIGLIPVTANISVKGWEKATLGKFPFNKTHLLDTSDLYAKLDYVEITEVESLLSTLERNMGTGEKYGFGALKKGLRTVSDRSARQVLESRPSVRRPHVERQLKEFLASPVRYCFLTGSSGVGKSTVCAHAANHASADNYVPLFTQVQPEQYFSLDIIANEIRSDMRLRPGDLEWSHVVAPWETELDPSPGSGAENEPEKLLLILDGLESADTEHLANQLAQLDRSLARTDPKYVKVIFSCRDSELASIQEHKLLRFYTQAADLRGLSLVDSRTIEVADFDNRELDAALNEIGAIHLLKETDGQGKFNDHIASMRSLLKHPGTFEHFAALYAVGDITEASEETWSTLLEKRLDQCFRKIEQLTGSTASEIKTSLKEFLAHCRENRIRDFSIPIPEVKELFPKLFEITKGRVSLYDALIASGVVTSGDIFTFRVTDAGGYLMSFQLEDQLAETNEPERTDVVVSWLLERWNYWPVADAVLSLIDRLATGAPLQKDLLDLILEVIAVKHQEEWWFGLMKPSVLEFLFEKARSETKKGLFYEYRNASRHVRYSPSNDELLRRALYDLSDRAKELAAELIGEYGLVSFASDLIGLLGNEDREVRDAAVKAFGKLGPTTIDPLLEKLVDSSADAPLRTRVTWALIYVGFRNDRISNAVAQQLPNASDDRDHDSFKQGLVNLATHLRDRGHTVPILEALASNPSPKLIRAAANYFATIEQGPAFDSLQRLVRSLNPEEDFENRFALASIISALVKLDRVRAGEFLRAEKEKIVTDPDVREIYPITSIFEHDVHELFPYFYEAAVKSVNPTKVGWGTIQLVENMGAIWSPAGLDSLSTAPKHVQNGSAAFIDALLPHIHDSGDFYGDRLNRIDYLAPVIKAQDPDFPEQARRLLPRVSPFGTEQLGKYYWILGDTSHEPALLEHFKSTIKRQDEFSNGRRVIAISGAARPLGTCGTDESAQYILSNLSSFSKGISRRFDEQTLLPLLIRRQCEPADIAKVVYDESADRIGRAVCLSVLRNFEPTEHVELYAQVLATSSDELLLTEAVFGLGVSRQEAAIKPLRELVRRGGVSASLKGYAARSLAAGLKATVALPDIEYAFKNLTKYEDIPIELFATAFMAIGDRSSVKILNDIPNLRPNSKRYISQAVFSLDAEEIDSQELASKLEVRSGSVSDFFEEQTFVLKGILRRARNELLEVVAEDLEMNRLNASSQKQISSFLRVLSENDSIDKELLVRIAVPIITSRDHGVRYHSLATLDFLNVDLCRRTFERAAASTTKDERAAACAVESLGHWNCDEALIREYRFDKRQFVREAADRAQAQRAKREMLSFHLNVFEKDTGMKRLVSYLCLCEKGDRHTLRRLGGLGEPNTLLAIQANGVSEEISARMRSDDNFKARNELKKLYEERGHVKIV